LKEFCKSYERNKKTEIEKEKRNQRENKKRAAGKLLAQP
jgi:hypothetical protein